MKQDKMMICPKAKECFKKERVSAEWRVQNLKPHCEPHEWKISCDSEDISHRCPACIPYEPQPDTCPDSAGIIVCKMCFKPRDASVNPCPSCGYGANLQPKHCIPDDVNNLPCDHDIDCQCEYCKSEQPTQMPLIDRDSLAKEWVNYCKHTIQRPSQHQEGMDWETWIAVKQRDADMAWHNAQQQPTQMPLREQDNGLLYGWTMDKPLVHFEVIANNLRNERQPSRANAVLYLIERCKRAEAHDSAIYNKGVDDCAEAMKEEQEERIAQAVKEFTEKVCTYISETLYISSSAEEKAVAHIRAMAEKE